MDKIAKEKRSAVMRKVKSKNTKPELIIRRLSHRLGYRYRLHVKSLPGCPDMVFARRRRVIFVHGCMWHGHDGCPNNRPPHSNQDYWLPKLDGNKKRDEANILKLSEMGWNVLVIWECEVNHEIEIVEKLTQFLGKP